MTRLTPLAALLALVALSACNTASGFGQDVESTGEAITDTSQDVADGL